MHAHNHSVAPAEALTGGERQAAAKKSTLVSVAVNLLLTAVQIAVGVFAHSSALVADGIHSLSDLVADFVVLLANRFSHLAADRNHPYGHSRFENAASLALGVLLIAVGIGMLGNAANKFADPSLIPRVHWYALAVAMMALVAKESLFRYMLAVANRVKSGMLVANAWHARSDAASSLVVAAGIVGNLLGWPLLDPLAAAIVGFMVARMGWNFSYDAMQDLMDRGLDEESVEAIRAELGETPGVLNVHDIRTRKTGDLAIIDAHLLVDSHISVSEGHQVALQARHRVMKRFAVADITIHIDADLADGPENLGLPPRQALLEELNRHFPDAPLRLDQLRAHYLDGRLELEVELDDDKDARRGALLVMAPPAAVDALRVCARLREAVIKN
ncbi:cation diffusion facilitator family transporter [Paludibacterium paludis]|nr:cation diffusion facilitator family transporter [Paludibacterium paludis]